MTAQTQPGRVDVVVLLTGYLLLLFLIPSRLVVGAIGAVGTPANLAALAGLGWWVLARTIPELGAHQGRQPLRTVLFAHVAIVFAAYAAAYTRPMVGVEVRAADRSLLGLAAGLGVALLIADGVPDRARLEALLRRVTWCGAAVAGLGILQFTLGLDVAAWLWVPGLEANDALELISQRSLFRRVAGTAIHAIEFSVVLAMVFPLALYFALDHPDRGRRERLVALSIALAIPMSVSRSGILALVVGMAVLALGWSWHRRIRGAAAAVVFVVALRFAIPGLVGTIRSLFAGIAGDPSIQGRTHDYAVVSELFQQRPWLGRGPGTFVPDRYPILDNQLLLSVVETGMLGALGLLAVLGTAIVLALRASRRRPTWPLGRAIAASIAAGTASLVTFDALSFPMFTGTLFVMLGSAGAVWRIRGAPDPVAPPASTAVPLHAVTS